MVGVPSRLIDGQRTTELEFPITTWDVAPQLKLKTRLTQSTSEESSSNLTILGNQNSVRRLQATGVQAPEVKVDLSEAFPLSPSEAVIVKDVWNKLRTWKECWAEIQEEVQATGTYTHTYEELAYGAQVSWRNASKCIARIQWNNMVVRDRRHVTDPDDWTRYRGFSPDCLPPAPGSPIATRATTGRCLPVLWLPQPQ